MLVVAKIDRMTRDAFDGFGVERRLRDAGASLYSVEEHLDTADPSARFMFGIRALMAQKYRENLSMETSKGKRQRVVAGLANGRVRYGYRSPIIADLADPPAHPDAVLAALRRLPDVIVPERAEAVLVAYQLYASGRYSDSLIADELNRRGYVMTSVRHPDGKPFGKDGVTAILRDPYYVGEVSYAGLRAHGRIDLALRRRHGLAETYMGAHEAIVPRELWERVQELWRSRLHPSTRPGAQVSLHLASGLVYCVRRRQPLRAQSAWINRGGRYRDASPERGIACTFTRRSIAMFVVDAVVGDVVSRLYLPSDWRTLVVDQVAAADESRRRVDRRSALASDLTRIQRLLVDGYITVEQFTAKRAAIEAEASSIEAVPVVDRDHAYALLDDLTRVWMDATDDERATLTRSLFTALWVDLDAGTVVHAQLHADLTILAPALIEHYETVTDMSGVARRNRRDSNSRSPA